MGLQFWSNISDFPEGGFCEFRSLDEVNELIDVFCSKRHSEIMRREDLMIEYFDKQESDAFKLRKILYEKRN